MVSLMRTPVSTWPLKRMRSGFSLLPGTAGFGG